MNIQSIFENLDYKGILAEYIIHGSLDAAINHFKQKIDDQNENHKTKEKSVDKKSKLIDLLAISDNIEEKIGASLIQTFNYTKDISFRDLDTPKLIVESFVDSDFFAAQRRYQVQDVPTKRYSMTDVFKDCNSNLVILGDLGAGKTTLIKKICQNVFRKNKEFYSKADFPILIRLSEINSFTSEYPHLTFFEFILNKLGFIIRDFNKNKFRNENSYVIQLKKIVCEFLEDIKIVFLLDGFDEINDVAIRKLIIEDVELISNSFINSKMILTSRTAEFDYSLSNTKTFEIAPLSDEQIDIFIKQYLKENENSETFKKELISSPYFDTSRKPLALAHLCAIYERYGSLPPKPKSVYKKIVNLYIEEWDAQRRLDRKKKGDSLSEYSNLANDRKFEFLTKFAYLITTEFGSTIFTENQITHCYNILFKEFDLPIKQSKKIVQEIEGHSGLILQTSHDTFEFSHKSIHEFLTAEYISRMGTLPKKLNILHKVPNELAIATALSSEPNTFLFRLFFRYIKNGAKNKGFTNPFLNRILLEKPDFRVEPILGLTLSYIYTILKFGEIGALKNTRNFLNATDLSTTNEILKKIIQTNPNVKESISQFLKYYTIDYNYSVSLVNSDYSIVRLEKKHNIENVNKNDLAQFLVVPALFL